MTILDRFKNVHAVKNGWTAKCPAHEDAHNSLSISHIDDKWLLKCHAGCAIDAIVSALGINLSDLFDTPKPNGKAKSRASLRNISIAMPMVILIKGCQPPISNSHSSGGTDEMAGRD